MSAFFITSTGTDIGKTFVTAGLIRHLKSIDEKVSALKPIVSGFDWATAAVSDPGQLLAALDIPITDEAMDNISPWRFSAALSPDMASAREDIEIDFDLLTGFCREADATGTLFIEGVGGVMVPLDRHHTVLDWMAALKLPVILVAGSYLGTISHTLTALECLANRRLDVRALVISETGDGAVPIEDTVATLTRFTRDLAIATIPRVSHPLDAKDNFAGLWGVIR
ncbi:MAG TPA: dethiobiotin synthase [Rhizomicrobium sp.]|jgi:dethiobiotin synthetase